MHVTEEAKNKMKNDKVVTIDDLADSTRDWRATCMETDVLAERKKINKKKKKCGDWSRNTWKFGNSRKYDKFHDNAQTGDAGRTEEGRA